MFWDDVLPVNYFRDP